MKQKVYAIVTSQHEIDSIIRHFRPDDRKDDDSENPRHLVIYVKDDGQQAMRNLLWHLSATGTIDCARNNRFAEDTNNEVKSYPPRTSGADMTSDIPLIFLCWEGKMETSFSIDSLKCLLESLGYIRHE